MISLQVRTVLEMDFGQPVCDINYFGSLDDVPPEDRVFVCGQYSGVADGLTQLLDVRLPLAKL